MAKSTYTCILYEQGDKVVDKHKGGETLEVESTDVRYVGIYPCQFLKFKDKDINIVDISNFYIPAEETIEKYKNGLNYFIETNVRVQAKGTQGKASKATPRVHSAFAKQVRKKVDNTLTEEDLKPKVMSRASFMSSPLKKKDESN